MLAGIIAIALRSLGFIGKLLYEAIEEIDTKQVEAITATGAPPAQVIDLCHRAADTAGIRRDLRVPLGHQHPRIRHTWPGWCRRHRFAARGIAQHIGLAAGDLDPIAHLGTVVLSEWVSAKLRHAII